MIYRKSSLDYKISLTSSLRRQTIEEKGKEGNKVRENVIGTRGKSKRVPFLCSRELSIPFSFPFQQLPYMLVDLILY